MTMAIEFDCPAEVVVDAKLVFVILNVVKNLSFKI